MKHDTLNPVIVRLIFTTGILLLFTWGANAAEPGGMKSLDQMQGIIEMGEKNAVLLATGDRVKLKLKNPEAVIMGDRLDIYEPVNTSLVDGHGDALLGWTGRLVITSLDGGMVFGTLEAANREITAGSHLAYTAASQQGRYLELMRAMTAFMADPARHVITVALPDVTDGAGNVTRISEQVYLQLSQAICERPQFHCIERGALRTFLGQYDVATGISAGELVRGKVASQFGADWFINGQFVSADSLNNPAHNGSSPFIFTVTAYDMGHDRKTLTSSYSVSASEFNSVSGFPDELLVAFRPIRHSFLRVTLDEGMALSGRRVDNLFLLPLEEYVDQEYRRYIEGVPGGRIVMGNIEMTLDGKQLQSEAGGVYYEDVISAGTHILRVSAVPCLMGRGQSAIGKRLEKSVELDISPDAAFASQVVVGTVGRQGLIAVDTRPMKKYPFEGVIADGR